MSIDYSLPGIRVREHTVAVPLDWADAASEPLTLFARELVATDRRHDDLPLLLYLQGGPGFGSPRPLARTGWIGEALKTHRVVLLDQRGTGRSSRIEGKTLAARGDAARQADYLACFRADSIVADAEHLRTTVFGGRRWSTLGQSYGGFVTLTYLSRAPEALEACYVTGGLPALQPDAAEVYRRTYPRTAAKNAEFYARFPHHRETLARVADRLAQGDVRLPDGDLLTVRRFQSMGIDFGMKPGFARLHYLLDDAFGIDGDLTDAFLCAVGDRTSFAVAPLFAALQESIYGAGAEKPTPWAAWAEHQRHPEAAEDARPLLMTGEMIYPWMFEEIRALRPFRAAVDVLAHRAEWPALYDLDRLAANDVPVAAAVYYDDMFVDAGLQLATAARLGSTRTWVTNEFEHDGLETPRVFATLRELVENDLTTR